MAYFRAINKFTSVITIKSEKEKWVLPQDGINIRPRVTGCGETEKGWKGGKRREELLQPDRPGEVIIGSVPSWRAHLACHAWPQKPRLCLLHL